jgi:2-polyprenyl-3-methyl-5-hydroxy-6-metoxy-1,4-benzoquinol methylase
MKDPNSSRAAHEIEHGRKLARHEPERIWGWDTPAGRLRAARRAELIISGAALGPGKRALEIGCGTGLFTEKFAQSGAQIVAVDISPELLEKARARGLPESQVRFLAMPFEQCDVEGPFDAVIGSSVLHHLDIRQALAKIFTLLKPGGVLFFAEPNMLNPLIIVLKNIKWIKRRFGDSPNETAFFRWRFLRLLLETGFEKPLVIPYDWLHPATPKNMISAVKAAGGILEKTPLLKEFAGSLLIQANRPLH